MTDTGQIRRNAVAACRVRVRSNDANRYVGLHLTEQGDGVRADVAANKRVLEDALRAWAVIRVFDQAALDELAELRRGAGLVERSIQQIRCDDAAKATP